MVRASVTARGEAVLLVAPQENARVLQGRDEQPGWAMFPHSRAKEETSVGVVVHGGEDWYELSLDGVPVAHPHAQVLPSGEALLVGARCRRHKDGRVECNALVYGSDGKLRDELVFGDGIQDVQVSPAGEIWVSYFDEGIFGNYGWGGSGAGEPIGASGLLCFDARGEKVWEFAPRGGLNHMADCYALNVDNESVWAYYYTEFPLVRIGSDREMRWWSTPISGANAVAVSGSRVLFFGGYQEERTRCVLGEMRGEAVEKVTEYGLELPDGEWERAQRVIGRGPELHIFTEENWYRVDVREM